MRRKSCRDSDTERDQKGRPGWNSAGLLLSRPWSRWTDVLLDLRQKGKLKKKKVTETAKSMRKVEQDICIFKNIQGGRLALGP